MPDHHDVVVRRRVLAGVGVLALVVIVLLIASLVGGGNREAIEQYNQSVSTIARESTEQVGTPLFEALAGARGEQGETVTQRINELAREAAIEEGKASKLSVPSGLDQAQRNFMLVLDLRSEGIGKIQAHIGEALSGQSASAAAYKQLAGAMEVFLTSDVVYSQRVAPFIQEALSQNGAGGQTTSPSQFLPNLGWLETGTLAARTGGHVTSSTQNGSAASGTQGSTLAGVSVGSNSLAAAPELNHIHSGVNPTFTVKVENSGSAAETNVTVQVAVVAAGKQYTAFRSIESIPPGQSANAEVPVEGVPLNTGAKISVTVEPVPGETNVENNKGTYEAIFS